MKTRPLPSADRLRDVFDYDQYTGHLRWRIKVSKKTVAGAIAGCTTSNGGIKIGIDGSDYKAHRIIWKWMTGEEPPILIDHKDLDVINNRWVNLRAATNSLNMANRPALSSNLSSGLKGAYHNNGSWMSRIKKDGIDYYLGNFKTAEDAHDAYKKKAAELFGEFARAS